MAIRVVELFAGVGGFRLGLEGPPDSSRESDYKVVWSNQWEPNTKKQHAANIYVERWALTPSDSDPQEYHGEGEIFVNKNIDDIDVKDIPEHDLLVGGFPCQDYSVARTLSGERGIEGDKGKLWYSIKRLITDINKKPKIIFLENVPRLLNSPASKRGFNFFVVCEDLLSLGYDVEWRLINAAEYGMPQKRMRVFIIAYRTDSEISPQNRTRDNINNWLFGEGTGLTQEEIIGPFAKAFPVKTLSNRGMVKFPRLEDLSKKMITPFRKTGFAWIDGNGEKWLYTEDTICDGMGYNLTLGDIIVKPEETNFDSSYIIDKEDLAHWRYCKASKREFRLNKTEREVLKRKNPELVKLFDECKKAPFHERSKMWEKHRDKFVTNDVHSFRPYDEGPMHFDQLDKPSRTIVTSEIRSGANRLRHIFEYEPDKYRRMMPIEAERLNMFPDNWTKVDGISDSQRGFLMGNALVVGIIEKLSYPIAELLTRKKNRLLEIMEKLEAER